MLKGIIKNRLFKNKKIDKNVRLFDESELHDNVESFLSESRYTIKDVMHINKKVREINKDERDIKKLKEFLETNKNIKNDKKLVELVLELCKIIKNRKEVIKSNLERSKRFVKFLSENQMNFMDDFVKIYEMIVSLENYEKRIEILDNYITNNKNALSEDNLLNEMELLLQKDIKLEELYKMNKLEEKMIEIKETLDKDSNDTCTKNESMLIRQYMKLKKQTKKISKELSLIRTA